MVRILQPQYLGNYGPVHLAWGWIWKGDYRISWWSGHLMFCPLVQWFQLKRWECIISCN